MTEQTASPGKAPAVDPRARAEQLRAELAEAEAAIAPPPGTAKVRVEPPHDSFTVGGLSVGRDFTLVPVAALAGLLAAADGAGVTIKEA